MCILLPFLSVFVFVFVFADSGSFGWGGVGISGMPNGQVLNGGLPTLHPPAATAAAAFPTSQSMNFPAKTWHTNPAGNPFVVSVSNAQHTVHSKQNTKALLAGEENIFLYVFIQF